MDHFQRKLASSDEGFNENMKGHAPLEEKRTIEEPEREPLGRPSSTEPSQPIPFLRTPEIGNTGATVTIQQNVKDWREIKKFIEIQRANEVKPMAAAFIERELGNRMSEDKLDDVFCSVAADEKKR